ncbi:MAG: glycosyltransferase family 1 protein [Acidobacteria bacterium]|nr:MAG: glycosyltransferase family 1 protein [Acidobacteriota bacterium]
MLETLYDARWVGNHGIGRFAGELLKLLPRVIPFQSVRRPWHPLDPVLLGAALWKRNPRLFFSPGYNSPLGWPGRFIFTLHDLNHLRVPENSNAAKRAYYRYVIAPACHRAEYVLTVSEYSKAEIAAWAKVPEEKIINVGNGVGAPFSPAGPKYEPGYPYLLYVGSRKPHKNLPRLLKAYVDSGVLKDIRLVLSGEPDRQITAEISRLNLNGKVEFVALSGDVHLSEVYRGAVALLFPSLYEGFGLPPLEAMACGVPVLTSNVCSLPEVVGEAAVLVSPLNEEEIADGIRRLAENDSLRASLRMSGLMRAQKFTWSETARKTLEALKLATDVNEIYQCGTFVDTKM